MAEKIYPALEMPGNVARETVTIWAGGVALDADIYRPTTITADAGLPAVALCHGWGGSKLTAERYAAFFAASDMVALTFTQPTWFDSGPLLQFIGDAPTDDMAKVRRVRQLVDPFLWIEGLRATVDYLRGEPGVDADCIGLWGTSFGGGIATALASDDTRIKALAIQVPALAPLSGPALAHARQRAVDAARGVIDPIPQGIDMFPNLVGTPHMAQMSRYNALATVDRLRIPTLILDAGEEEMFPIANNGARARDILAAIPGSVVEYHVIPGIDHYGIYFDGYAFGSRAARDWFARHL